MEDHVVILKPVAQCNSKAVQRRRLREAAERANLGNVAATPSHIEPAINAASA